MGSCSSYKGKNQEIWELITILGKATHQKLLKTIINDHGIDVGQGEANQDQSPKWKWPKITPVQFGRSACLYHTWIQETDIDSADTAWSGRVNWVQSCHCLTPVISSMFLHCFCLLDPPRHK